MSTQKIMSANFWTGSPRYATPEISGAIKKCEPRHLLERDRKTCPDWEGECTNSVYYILISSVSRLKLCLLYNINQTLKMDILNAEKFCFENWKKSWNLFFRVLSVSYENPKPSLALHIWLKHSQTFIDSSLFISRFETFVVSSSARIHDPNFGHYTSWQSVSSIFSQSV